MSCWSRDRASTSSGCTLCASARVQFSYIQLCLCGFTHQLPRKSVVFDIFCSSTFFYSRRNTANAYNIVFCSQLYLHSRVFCSQVYFALKCILLSSVFCTPVYFVLLKWSVDNPSQWSPTYKWPHGQDSGYVIVRFPSQSDGDPVKVCRSLWSLVGAACTMMLECQTSKQGFLSTSNGWRRRMSIGTLWN